MWKKIKDNKYDIGYYKSRGLFHDRVNYKLKSTIGRLSERLPRESVIADIAGGTGTLARNLAEHFETVYLVDISQEALDHSKNLSDKTHNLRLDITKDMAGKIPPLDAAFCINVLEHFKAADGRKIFKNIANVVKKGGYVYISIPVKSPLTGLALSLNRKLGFIPKGSVDWSGELDHMEFYAPKEFGRIIPKELKVVATGYFVFHPILKSKRRGAESIRKFVDAIVDALNRNYKDAPKKPVAGQMWVLMQKE